MRTLEHEFGFISQKQENECDNQIKGGGILVFNPTPFWKTKSNLFFTWISWPSSRLLWFWRYSASMKYIRSHKCSSCQPFLSPPFYGLYFIKLGCLRQRLLSSPLERGAGCVLRQTYTPLYPLFLEGNYKSMVSHLAKVMPICCKSRMR